jgi:hypothetical protein
VNWASAELQGSSFGRFLQLGLAGAADTGDATGDEVWLHELVAYLRREVNEWSQSNRGEPQQPILLPANLEDFRVTHNVRDGGLLEELRSKFYEPKSVNSNIKPAQIELRTLEFTSNENEKVEFKNLQPLDLVRRDPLACRDLELGLLRLEGLSQGGSAYADTAKREVTLRKKELDDAVEQQKRFADSRSVWDHFGLETIRVAAHALPIAEYFGACDAELSGRVGQLWSDPANIVASSSVSEAAMGEKEREFVRNL